MALKEFEEIRLKCIEMVLRYGNDTMKKPGFMFQWADRFMNYVYMGHPEKDFSKTDKRRHNEIKGKTNYDRDYPQYSEK